MTARPRVFVSRQIDPAQLERLRAAVEVDLWTEHDPPPPDTFRYRAQGKDGVLTMLSDRLTGDVMDALGAQLRVISQMAVGYDNIDVAAAQARNIRVGHTPGVLTAATADIAFALLLAVARRVVEGMDYIRAGRWQTWHPQMLLGTEVSGATLGIVGFGRIGQAVAQRGRGFDMPILASSPRLQADDPALAAAGGRAVALETLLRESDFISIHTPLNSASRHLVNRETLALMKPTAIVINTARGGVVDHTALYDALHAGRLGGAGLDVTDPEPIAADHPLLTLPNVTIVPHVGSATVQTRAKMAALAVDNLLAGLAGQPLVHEVPA